MCVCVRAHIHILWFYYDKMQQSYQRGKGRDIMKCFIYNCLFILLFLGIAWADRIEKDLGSEYQEEVRQKIHLFLRQNSLYSRLSGIFEKFI